MMGGNPLSSENSLLLCLIRSQMRRGKKAEKTFKTDFWNSRHGFIISITLNGLTVAAAAVGVGLRWHRARLEECSS